MNRDLRAYLHAYVVEIIWAKSTARQQSKIAREQLVSSSSYSAPAQSIRNSDSYLSVHSSER